MTSNKSSDDLFGNGSFISFNILVSFCFLILSVEQIELKIQEGSTLNTHHHTTYASEHEHLFFYPLWIRLDGLSSMLGPVQSNTGI